MGEGIAVTREENEWEKLSRAYSAEAKVQVEFRSGLDALCA